MHSHVIRNALDDPKNSVYYISNRNCIKAIGTFLSKKSLVCSHLAKNALGDPKKVKCSAHYFMAVFGPN